eukprot:s2852_g6.t1
MGQQNPPATTNVTRGFVELMNRPGKTICVEAKVALRKLMAMSKTANGNASEGASWMRFYGSFSWKGFGFPF